MRPVVLQIGVTFDAFVYGAKASSTRGTRWWPGQSLRCGKPAHTSWAGPDARRVPTATGEYADVQIFTVRPVSEQDLVAMLERIIRGQGVTGDTVNLGAINNEARELLAKWQDPDRDALHPYT